MRYGKFIISLTISLLLATQLAFADRLEETFKKRIDANGFTNLSIQNVNGSIDISSWDKDEIEIVAYKKVYADDPDRAKHLMTMLKVEIVEDSERLNVQTVLPSPRKSHNNGFFSWLFNGGNSGTSISYELKVPRKIDLDVLSTNGGLSIEGCQGKMTFVTTNGKIKAEELSGSVKARSTNGSLNIQFVNVSDTDEMSFKTTNGSIKVYLPSNTNADIEARTTNGSIRCELPLMERYERSKRRLEAEMNDGGPLYYFKTTNGSVSILEY